MNMQHFVVSTAKITFQLAVSQLIQLASGWGNLHSKTCFQTLARTQAHTRHKYRRAMRLASATASGAGGKVMFARRMHHLCCGTHCMHSRRRWRRQQRQMLPAPPPLLNDSPHATPLFHPTRLEVRDAHLVHTPSARGFAAKCFHAKLSRSTQARHSRHTTDNFSCF